MLTLYRSPVRRAYRPADLAEETLQDDIVWIDLLKPEPEEVAFVKRTTGLDVPTVANLSEIESSSRLRNKNGVLYLSMPIVSYAGAIEQPPSPLGFVLSKDVLVTIRYTQLRSFDAAAAKYSAGGPTDSIAAFTAIVDEMVDLLADLLEQIGTELDEISRDIFPRRSKRRRVFTRFVRC